MQLNPEIPFSTQIKNLKGDSFEKVVSAALYYTGYHIDRNIIFSLNKETIAEIDVVASLITPLNEIRIAIECKGANPSFNDLRKFASIKGIFDSNEFIVDLIVFGANSTRKSHELLSDKLKIKLLKKEDLSKLVLPILWGTGELTKNRIKWLNRYICMFHIENYYTKTIIDNVKNESIKTKLTHYRKYLYSDLWSIQDPIDQLNDSFDKATSEFKHFSEQIAKLCKSTAYSEITNPRNEIIQAAMFLELKHRMLNLNAFSRCSIVARSKQGREMIAERTPAIREALNTLCDYNISPSKFMNFVTRFIYLWGGCIIKQDSSIKEELSIIANETGISDDNALQFIKILYRIYQTGDGLFVKNNQRFFMKYVPSAIRAFGIIHRESIKNIPLQQELFPEDIQNIKMLDQCFSEYGGRTSILI